MHMYEAMGELWIKFKQEHSDLAAKYQNEKLPNTCPKILRDYAPWEMRRTHDSSCLCSDCEGMNALRRGVTGACAAIDEIIKHVETTNSTSASASTDQLAATKSLTNKQAGLSIHKISRAKSVSEDLTILREIKKIISMPYKYDTIVACLQPCLSTGELEDANYSCLHEKYYPDCGFCKLWSTD